MGNMLSLKNNRTTLQICKYVPYYHIYTYTDNQQIKYNRDPIFLFCLYQLRKNTQMSFDHAALQTQSTPKKQKS